MPSTRCWAVPGVSSSALIGDVSGRNLYQNKNPTPPTRMTTKITSMIFFIDKKFPLLISIRRDDIRFSILYNYLETRQVVAIRHFLDLLGYLVQTFYGISSDYPRLVIHINSLDLLYPLRIIEINCSPKWHSFFIR